MADACAYPDIRPTNARLSMENAIVKKTLKLLFYRIFIDKWKSEPCTWCAVTPYTFKNELEKIW